MRRQRPYDRATRIVIADDVYERTGRTTEVEDENFASEGATREKVRNVGMETNTAYDARTTSWTKEGKREDETDEQMMIVRDQYHCVIRIVSSSKYICASPPFFVFPCFLLLKLFVA